MGLLKKGYTVRVFVSAILALLLALPSVGLAFEYKSFSSKEYGFSMKYPATWQKMEKYKVYYVVFQSPEMTEDFRSSVHVVCHGPTKDPISRYLKEFRNGFEALKKEHANKGKDSLKMQIVEDGAFKCDVPGAHFFFVQAQEFNQKKKKIWLDIVVVFYLKNNTLLRISCLTPSNNMAKLQPMFNEVLVSVNFPTAQPAAQPQARPAPAPGTPAPVAKPAPAPADPAARPAPAPAAPAPAPAARMAPAPAPGTQAPAPQPAPAPAPAAPAARPAPAPAPSPPAPARPAPPRPGGIVR